MPNTSVDKVYLPLHELQPDRTMPFKGVIRVSRSVMAQLLEYGVATTSYHVPSPVSLLPPDSPPAEMHSPLSIGVRLHTMDWVMERWQPGHPDRELWVKFVGVLLVAGSLGVLREAGAFFPVDVSR